MNIFVEAILPVFYFALLLFSLTGNQKFKRSKLPVVFIALFFAFKCVAGFLYSYIALKYIPNRGDIWPFYEDGLELYRVLIHQPAGFISRLQEMFNWDAGNALDSHGGVAQSAFEGIKLLQFVFNIFSFGNLYTNTILFNGIAAFAFLRCWIFLKDQFNSWIPGAWLFLFPSAFFYTAGIHKEGIIFILIACLIPVCFKLMIRATANRSGITLLLFFLFFFFKFFVAISFAASLILYWLLVKFPLKKWIILPVFIIVGIAGFFLSGVLLPNYGLPQAIVKRQQEFLTMDAASSFHVKMLAPNAGSFVKALPGAVFNVFFKPLPGQGGKTLYYVYTFEIFLFWAFVLYMFIKNKGRLLFRNVPSMIWALFIFALFNLIIIGYTIPNIGATMRYRSIFLPFTGLFFWYWLNDTYFFNLKPAYKSNPSIE